MTPSKTLNVGRWPKGMPPLSSLGVDLLTITPFQRWHALALPLVSAMMLGLSTTLGWTLAAFLSAAAYTFYSYGSTSHDLVHGSLGFSRPFNHILLSLIELVGLRSGHAYQAAHLQHHARFPHTDDVEGAPARGTFIGAVLAGPLHQLRIWCWAVRHARRYRVWIFAEGLAFMAILIAAIAAWPVTRAPLVYVALVVLGSWTFPLFTGYLPHNPQGADALQRTRRFRGAVAAVIIRQHLYHLEHHLYPAVPHQHWQQLATRLDPHFDSAGVRPTVLGF